MLESTSTMVLAVNEGQSVFNEVSSFCVGFLNGAYFLPLQEQSQKRVSTTEVQWRTITRTVNNKQLTVNQVLETSSGLLSHS
jgi:hypothetical protein